MTDSVTHAPLPNVSVCEKNNQHCTLTNTEGHFRLIIDGNTHNLTLTTTGYHANSVFLHDSTHLPLDITLSKAYATLKNFVVSAKRGKYRNKNNPAVDLIRKVIANKSQNGPGAGAYTSYSQYEKVRVLVDKLPNMITDSRLIRKFHFFFENRDTTLVPGKSLLPVYLEEVFSENYARSHPENKKKLVLGRKSVDFGEYIDMKGISIALNRLYEDVNIYDNAISCFTMQFVSPIADLAPTFYMFFIRDTIVENGVKLVKLYFTPRNPEDLLFRGTLYITLDGNYAVRKVELGVSTRTNLNWVRDFHIDQDFEKGAGDRYHLAQSDMVAAFSFLPKSRGMFGTRSVTITQFRDTTLPDSVFRGPSIDTVSQAGLQPIPFWGQNRPIPLSVSEQKTYTNTDSLIRMPAYRRMMDYLTLFSTGYKAAGKFDIGPVDNFYTFNPLEGSRVELGGRSTTRLSTRYYTESYVAYGFKDERVKYYLSGTYSINNRSIYSYPFNYIRASYLHEAQPPGRDLVFAKKNGLLSSFNRGKNNKWLYNNIFKISNIHEFGNHFSYEGGIRYWKQHPADSLIYLYPNGPGQFDTVRSLTTSELSATIRWAPHEQFFQSKAARADIINKYPVISLKYTKGISGLFGGQFSYDAFNLNIFKRCYLAPIGFTDVMVTAGYILGNLPFPLLVTHPANTSYYYSPDSYNLMNSQEFVSDHYAGVYIDHYFNGFFLNKVPLLKKLRLREVVAAKILYGGLRDENNPALSPSQMRFPLVNGAMSTYSLNHGPYVEASVGIYNIFNLIRIDLVKRFTYLDHPDVSRTGIRASTILNF